MKTHSSGARKAFGTFTLVIAVFLSASACPTRTESTAASGVLATLSFIADIAQNVAGAILPVRSLVPAGADPHAYQATPSDVAAIEDARVLITNGGGLEASMERYWNTGGDRLVIDCSQGLAFRDQGPGAENDPHFWLDPVLVITYVDNIRDGLSAAFPADADLFRRNAESYAARLRELDAEIRALVETLPPARRVLVTSHEELGYFADRYGFRIVGTILPGVSSGATAEARHFAELADLIRSSGVPAVFTDVGGNPTLAEQLARESGARVASGLMLHALSGADGPAPTYIEMMRHDAALIVAALSEATS